MRIVVAILLVYAVLVVAGGIVVHEASRNVHLVYVEGTKP